MTARQQPSSETSFAGISRVWSSVLYSLLRLWGDYNDLEKRLVQERRVQCGALAYSKCQPRDGGSWRFFLDGATDQRLRAAEVLGDGSVDSLKAREEVPDDLIITGDPDGTAAELPTEWKPNGPDSFAGKLMNADWQRGILEVTALTEVDFPPPDRGVLIVSVRGDQTRLVRRERARLSIVTGSNPLPQLGLILEGQPAPSAVHRRHQPWSGAARRALGGEPTFRRNPSDGCGFSIRRTSQ